MDPEQQRHQAEYIHPLSWKINGVEFSDQFATVHFFLIPDLRHHGFHFLKGYDWKNPSNRDLDRFNILLEKMLLISDTEQDARAVLRQALKQYGPMGEGL